VRSIFSNKTAQVGGIYLYALKAFLLFDGRCSRSRLEIRPYGIPLGSLQWKPELRVSPLKARQGHSRTTSAAKHNTTTFIGVTILLIENKKTFSQCHSRFHL
jgi:hypothetical protein